MTKGVSYVYYNICVIFEWTFLYFLYVKNMLKKIDQFVCGCFMLKVMNLCIFLIKPDFDYNNIYPDWFDNKRDSVSCQINRESLTTIQIWFNLKIMRSPFLCLRITQKQIDFHFLLNWMQYDFGCNMIVAKIWLLQ